MRFFFHVLGNGITVEDGSGTVLPGPEAARLYASVIAGELAQDGNQYRGCDVCAVDEVGNEIARLSVVVPS